MYSHYDRLTKGANGKNLKSILEEVISRMDEYKKDIASLQEYCNNLNEEGQSHIKRLVFTDSILLRIQAEIRALLSLVDAN